jgi:hypothetical protein
MKREFSVQISKNALMSNLIKARPMGAELFRAARHDDVESRFSEFNEGV